MMHLRDKANSRGIGEHLVPDERFTVPKNLPRDHAISILFDCKKKKQKNESDSYKPKSGILKTKKAKPIETHRLLLPLQLFDEELIYTSKPEKKSKRAKKVAPEVAEYHLVQDGAERIIAVNTKDLQSELPSHLSEHQLNKREESFDSDVNMFKYELRLPKTRVINGNPYSRPLHNSSFDSENEQQKAIECKVTKKKCLNQPQKNATPSRCNTMALESQKNATMREKRHVRFDSISSDDKENIAPTIHHNSSVQIPERFRIMAAKHRQNARFEHDKRESSEDDARCVQYGLYHHDQHATPVSQACCMLEDVSDSESQTSPHSSEQLPLPTRNFKSVKEHDASEVTIKEQLAKRAVAADQQERQTVKAKNFKYRNFIQKLAGQLNSVRNALHQMQQKLFDNFSDCDSLASLLEQYRYQRNILNNLKKLEIAIDVIQKKGYNVKTEILEFRKSIEESNASLRSMYFNNMRNLESVP